MTMTPEQQKALDEKAASDKAAADKAAADKAAADKAAADKLAAGGNEDVDLKDLGKGAVAMIEKVRQQEKQKLYPKIQKLEADLKAKDEELKQLSEKLTALDTKGLSEQEVLKRQIEKMTNDFNALKTTIDTEKVAAQKAVRAAELKAYREQKLREAGSGLILELVNGQDEVEIDASIERAKTRYSEVHAEVLAKVKAEGTPAPKTGADGKNPPVDNGSGNGGGKKFTKAEIDAMSPDDFKKNRKAILESLKE